MALTRDRARFPWLALVRADAGSDARQVKAAVAASPVLAMRIVRRAEGTEGFAVQPHRWMVERTFSGFGRDRRLAKDYENLAATRAAFVILAAIRIAQKRPARPFRSGSQDSVGFDDAGPACKVHGIRTTPENFANFRHELGGKPS